MVSLFHRDGDTERLVGETGRRTTGDAERVGDLDLNVGDTERLTGDVDLIGESDRLEGEVDRRGAGFER